jgi:ribosomal protein S18 acetylase RimI-like enzyme
MTVMTVCTGLAWRPGVRHHPMPCRILVVSIQENGAMLSFRPVTDDDYEYLYALNKQTMQEHAEKIYGPWNEDVVRRIFAERWRPESTRIVVIDGQDGGMLEVLPTETGVHLENIRVAPEHQGRGIGSRLISEVLRDAHGRGLPVTLRVLKLSPARRLYERLGFVVVGETEPHYLMEAHPTVP